MFLPLVGNIVTLATDEYYFIGCVPKAGSHNVGCVEAQKSGHRLSIRVPSYGPWMSLCIV